MKKGHQKKSMVRWTTSEIKKLQKYRAAGLNYDEIAKKLKRSERSVQLKTAGLRKISNPLRDIPFFETMQGNSAEFNQKTFAAAMRRLFLYKWVYRLAWFVGIALAVIVADVVLEMMRQWWTVIWQRSKHRNYSS